MNTATATIVSRYGNRVIEWDRATLEAILTQLRRERQQHIIDNDGSAALIQQAERIKDNATNKSLQSNAATQ